MTTSKCPHCESTVGGESTICGECGKALNGAVGKSGEAARSKGRMIFSVLSVALVALGGVVLLLVVGIVPNPFSSGKTVAIVNGEKISQEEVEEKLNVYKNIYGKSAKTDFSTPEGKKILADMSAQVLNSLIQEKILVTEAKREGISVSNEEVEAKIATIKKAMNLSDEDFAIFLKNHAMNLDNFRNRVAKELEIMKLIGIGTGKGLAKEAWIKELQARAKVETFKK